MASNAFDLSYLAVVIIDTQSVWILLRVASLLAVAYVVYCVWSFTPDTLQDLQPPAVPHWIPFLGHGLEFIKDFEGMVSRIQ